MLKRERLQRAGCRHYWVFDPDEPSVLAFTLDGDVYVESGRALGDELFSATEPFEISFTLRSLYRTELIDTQVRSLSREEALAQKRFGMRPARQACRPAITACRIAVAIATGSSARVARRREKDGVAANSIARAASEAVPTPASSTTGTPAADAIISMLCGLMMPRPVPIGEPSGITTATPASSNLRARIGSSLV